MCNESVNEHTKVGAVPMLGVLAFAASAVKFIEVFPGVPPA